MDAYGAFASFYVLKQDSAKRLRLFMTLKFQAFDCRQTYIRHMYIQKTAKQVLQIWEWE